MARRVLWVVAAAAVAGAAGAAGAAPAASAAATDGDTMVAADGTRVPLTGWVAPLPPADAALESTFCNIDRRSTLSRHQFEAEYRCVFACAALACVCPWRVHTTARARALLAGTSGPSSWAARRTSAST